MNRTKEGWLIDEYTDEELNREALDRQPSDRLRHGHTVSFLRHRRTITLNEM